MCDKQAKNKILCLFSGGLDSAGCLWMLLNDDKYSDYEILVHHVNIINHENRFYAESAAVKYVLNEMEIVLNRKISFTYSVADFSSIPYPSNIPYDSDIYLFTAAGIVKSDPLIKHIAIGKTADEPGSGVNPGFIAAKKIFRLITGLQSIQLFPVQELSKRKIWDMLPQSVRNKTWSCRRPQYKKSLDGKNVQILPCNSCPTCKSILAIKGGS